MQLAVIATGSNGASYDSVRGARGQISTIPCAEKWGSSLCR